MKRELDAGYSTVGRVGDFEAAGLKRELEDRRTRRNGRARTPSLANLFFEETAGEALAAAARHEKVSRVRIEFPSLLLHATFSRYSKGKANRRWHFPSRMFVFHILWSFKVQQ